MHDDNNDNSHFHKPGALAAWQTPAPSEFPRCSRRKGSAAGSASGCLGHGEIWWIKRGKFGSSGMVLLRKMENSQTITRKNRQKMESLSDLIQKIREFLVIVPNLTENNDVVFEISMIFTVGVSQLGDLLCFHIVLFLRNHSIVLPLRTLLITAA